MDPRLLLERLVSFERRVRQLYLMLGDRANMPAEVRFFWNRMAEDERHHLAILERSAGLIDLLEAPPQVSEEVLAAIEEKIAAAETAVQRSDLSLTDALGQSLILEGSEINSLDEAWFRGFRSTIASLLQAMMPEEETHIRRLVEAVHTFSPDKALQDQAAMLWATYQRERLGFAKLNAPTKAHE